MVDEKSLQVEYGRPLQDPSPDLAIASMMGCLPRSNERRLLELSQEDAAYQLVRNASNLLCDQGVRFWQSDLSDNHSYINRMEGTISPWLTVQAKELSSWGLQRQISVRHCGQWQQFITAHSTHGAASTAATMNGATIRE